MSAVEVRGSLFWKELQSQLAACRELTLKKVAREEISVDKAQAVIYFLEMFTKMTNGVESRIEQFEAVAQSERQQEQWLKQFKNIKEMS